MPQTTQSTADAPNWTNLGKWSYGIGAKTAYQGFHASCMAILAGSSPTRTKKPQTETRRGRPTGTTKVQKVAKGKSGVGTQDVVAYITANPGVTLPILRGAFPTVGH